MRRGFEPPPVLQQVQDVGLTDNAASYGVIVREILGQGRGGLTDFCSQLCTYPPKEIRD